MPRTKWTHTGNPRGRPRGWRKAAFLEDGTPNLTANQWRAVKAEAAKCHAGHLWRPAADVAREVGVSEQAVRGWRQIEAYKAAAQAEEDARFTHLLQRRLAKRDEEQRAAEAHAREVQRARRRRALRGLPPDVGGLRRPNPEIWRYIPGTPLSDETEEG